MEMATRWRAFWVLLSGWGRRRAEAKVARGCQYLPESFLKTKEGRTQAKSEHVRQGPRGVEDDVKLACGQEDPPAGDAPAKAPLKPGSEEEEARGVEEAEDGADDKLGVGEADEGHDGLGEAGEQDGADEGARHGAGEGEVVVDGV
jgi:hypothetical protein